MRPGAPRKTNLGPWSALALVPTLRMVLTIIFAIYQSEYPTNRDEYDRTRKRNISCLYIVFGANERASPKKGSMFILFIFPAHQPDFSGTWSQQSQ